MATSNVGDFGQCTCPGEIQLTWVQVRFTEAVGEPVVFGDVPQGRCPDCGNRYYSASTLRVIEHAYARTRLAAAGGL
jgi:hypothetical protein